MANETNINTQQFMESEIISPVKRELPCSAQVEWEKLNALKIKNEIRKENKIVRRCLIIFLSFLTSSWLMFTGYEIWQLATGRHVLPSSVSIAFITSALATVVGLWAIGLRYFFNTKQ